MADMRVRASIQATVALGQKLACLLQTLVELNPSSQSGLKDAHYDVQATSGTLRQIQDMYTAGLDENTGSERDAKSAVTSAYLDEIEKLAVKCGLIFKSIILVTQKAGTRGSSKEDDDNVSSVENLKNELLTGPIPDPGSIKWVKLVQIPTKYDQRDWLEPRFERLQEQLQWIRTGLLIHLHIFKLALLQNGPTERSTGAFENELICRSSIQLLRRRQVKFAKKKAKKQEKAQRQWELRRNADRSETASVTSVASSVRSSTTASTVVDHENSPNGVATVVQGAVEIVETDKVHKIDQTSTTDTKQGEAKQPINDKLTAVEARSDKSKTPRSFTLDGRLSSDLPAWFYDWKQRLFGSDDRFKADFSSNTLEAWIYYDIAPWKPYSKLPFGHKRLQYGLNKVIKDGKNERSTWNRYLELAKHRRTGLDQIVDEANQQQSRERVCIAFQEFEKGGGESFMVVFLSIRKEPKTISFKDAIGRHYTLPFETCRKWDAMKETLIQAFNHIDTIGPHVIEGHFDLQNSNGDVILPHLWNSTIKPGETITMSMWPRDIPVRGFYGPPPFVPNPLNGSEAVRIARMRQLQYMRMNAMRQQGLPGPPHVFPPPGPPGMHPPPPGVRAPRPRAVDIISVRSASSVSSASEYDISEKEDEQLMFVDFVEELEKTQGATVAEILRKFTTLKDVTDEDSLGDLLNADSDCDSDGSTSTSSSSEIIND